MQSFKDGALVYLKDELDRCPLEYRPQLEDALKNPSSEWTRIETYYLFAYSKQELWRNVDFGKVAIKMNLMLPSISHFRRAGFFTAANCEARVKDVVDTFAETIEKFGEKDKVDQLEYIIQFIISKDIEARKTFASNPRNKDYIKMFVEDDVRPEYRTLVAEAVKTLSSFIPKYVNTDNLGPDRPFRELEENLNDLPISLSTVAIAPSSDIPRPDVVMRNIDATSLSPRSASVSPPMEIDKPAEPLPPTHPEVRLPSPEPMDYKESKPAVTKLPLPSSRSDSNVEETSSPKRQTGRPRSSETSSSPKKVVASPFKEPSTERKPSIKAESPLLSTPKKRKSQTPKRTESSGNVKESSTPSSPLTITPKTRATLPPLLPPPPKSGELRPREARRRKTLVYTPPASPIPKSQVDTPPDEAAGAREEIALSSDASRGSSRLSNQPSAISSAVPSARSSEERNSRLSQNVPVSSKSPQKSCQTQFSFPSVNSKAGKKASPFAPYPPKRPSKNAINEVKTQTDSPFIVSEEVNFSSDSKIPISDAFVKVLKESKRPFNRKQAVELNLSLNKTDMEKLYPNPTSSKYYPLQKCLINLAKNAKLHEPVYSKVVKKPMDSHTISTLIGKDPNVGLLEMEMLWCMTAANNAISKSDKTHLSNVKEFLYDATENFQKTRAFEEDPNNV